MRRFSIRSVMVLILIAAVGLAAIRVASSSWAGAMLSVACFALTCALLGVAFGRNERRIYWTGFATLGWTYLALAYAPWLSEKFGEHLYGPSVAGPYIAEVIHAEPPSVGGFQSVPPGPLGAMVVTGGGRVGGGGVSYEVIMNSARIGVAMEALLWAMLGGWAALLFRIGEERSDRRGDG